MSPMAIPPVHSSRPFGALLACLSLLSIWGAFSQSILRLMDDRPWLVVTAGAIGISIWLLLAISVVTKYLAWFFRPQGSEGTTTAGTEKYTTLYKLAGIAVASAVVGVMAIDGTIQAVTGKRIFPPRQLDTTEVLFYAIVLLVILSPLVETLAMLITLELGRRVCGSNLTLSLGSALVWGIWHGYANHPYQAPSMIWLFWIFSTLYLRSRSDGISRSAAYLWVTVVHGGNNLIALFLLVAASSTRS